MNTETLRPRFHLMAIAVLCLLPVASTASSTIEERIKVIPDKVGIDVFYHGTRLTVRGEVPANCRAALTLSGRDEKHHLMRKERVGPFWMNVETVTVGGVPDVYYLLTSSTEPEGSAPREALSTSGVGYDALREHASIEQKGGDSDSIFREFIKLKESMGLYRIFPGGLTVDPKDENLSQIHAFIPIPARVPAGDYQLALTCYGEGQEQSQAAAKVTIQRTGFTKEMTELAFAHPALYGVLAVAVAMAAGIVTGFVFGSRGKGGH